MMTARKAKMMGLMNQILEVRYDNLDLEYKLCSELLEMATEDGYSYGEAFAYVYLVDSYMAQNGSLNSSVYIKRAIDLCETNGYNELLLPLYNFAGGYYRRNGDEQSALMYYLSGLDMAREQNQYYIECALYNNIGVIFQNREDIKTAKEYFKKAYEVIAPHMSEKNSFNGVLFLCNLAEVSQMLGEIEDSEYYLKLCENVETEALYKRYRLDVGWCGHYAACGDEENCRRYLEIVQGHHLETFKDPYYAYEAMLALVRFMLQIEFKEHAKQFLDYLERMGMETDWDSAFVLHDLKVRYCKKYGTQKDLADVYRQFHDLMVALEEVNNKVRADGMRTKIHLMRVLEENKAIINENAILEYASHIDELTGIFNRRYINKLLTKVIVRQDLYRIGFIMVDVDYFKQYNDCYGHQKGDDALIAVADCLKGYPEDKVCPGRYGGDEFICLCMNMSDEEIQDYICFVREKLADRGLEHKKSECGKTLTLSIGYCNEYLHDGMTADMLLELADEALYETKRAGRDGFYRKQRLETE